MVADGAVDGKKGEIDPVRVCEEFFAFVRRLRERFPGVLVKYAFCDSEAQYLINGLRKFMRRSGDSLEIGEYCIAESNKNRSRSFAALTRPSFVGMNSATSLI